MKKSLLSLPLLFLTTLGMSGCYVKKGLEFKVIAPYGAPSLVLASYRAPGEDSNFTISSSPDVVRSALMGNTYDAVIIDVVGGIKMIEKNAAPFSLVRVLTRGNIVTVGINGMETSQMTNNSNVVSFSKGSTPDLVFNYLYSSVNPTINYVDSAATAASIVCSGKYEGKAVDYVVSAEPALTNIRTKTTCPTYQNKMTEERLDRKFHEVTTKLGTPQNGFPQAGLFLRNSLVAEKRDLVDNFLKVIGEDLNDLATMGGKRVAENVASFGDYEAQVKLFGVGADNLVNLQFDKDSGANLNKLGFKPDNKDEPIYLKTFYKILNLQEPLEASISPLYH